MTRIRPTCAPSSQRSCSARAGRERPIRSSATRWTATRGTRRRTCCSRGLPLRATGRAWPLVARAMADRQDDAGAEEAFSRAAALDPGTDESLLARAAFLESRRRWAEARELELKLLARRPDSPDLLAALARTSLAEGDLEVASAHAHKLLGLATAAGPDSPDEERRDLAGALFRIAVPLLGAHRSQDALAALDGALRLFPRHPELAFYRGLALSQRGRNREAVQVFDQIESALGEGPAPAAAQAPAFLAPDPAQLLLDVR